jgi:hypothetical protein
MNQTTTTKSYECPAGLRRTAGGSSIWVRSPRTGATITITEGFFCDLPSRIVSRVAQSVSVGRHAVTFTRDELLAIVRLHQHIVDICSPDLGDSPFRRSCRSFSRAG